MRVRFSAARRGFTVNGVLAHGVHATIAKWYGCVRNAPGAAKGEWGDRFNLGRGLSVRTDLAKWLRAGLSNSPAVLAKLRAPARSIAYAIQQRGWRLVSVELPVSCLNTGVATAVDLLVATQPPKNARRGWRPSPTDPVSVCEVKVSGASTWNATIGSELPAGLVSDDAVVATPHRLAMIQLSVTHVLYSSTYQGQLQSSPYLFHVSAINGGVSCTVEALADWARVRVVPNVYWRLKRNHHRLFVAGEERTTLPKVEAGNVHNSSLPPPSSVPSTPPLPVPPSHAPP